MEYPIEQQSIPNSPKPRIKWTIDEDNCLRRICSEELPWKIVAERMGENGFSRDAKQCRDRWCNYLEHDLSMNNVWHEDEDKILLLAFQKYGPKWTQIQKIPLFQNRTQNQLKNRFYHSVQKRTIYGQNSITLKGARPKGRPTKPPESSQHRSQTVIPFERNPQNILGAPTITTVIPFERV
ncbi:hypothetical protein M9Y10_040952 [Tritrichomonas musculus]|uniref:Myb-like DNA-binding domain containing protein n=1 Tax=Tritrichomonas musculus TaxID=1915356 RepID=A0ABR2K328_9EUKA